MKRYQLTRSLFDAVHCLLANFRSDKLSRRLILGLLVCDVLLIAMHTVRGYAFWAEIGPPWLQDRRFNMNFERSYGEFFEYSKALLAAGLAMLTYFRLRQAIYIATACVLLIVLLDNALAGHENGGRFLSVALGLPAVGTGGAHETGELVFFLIEGVCILALFTVGLVRSEASHLGIGLVYVILVGLLGSLAVGLDALDSMLFGSAFFVQQVGIIIEDGGELVILTLLLGANFITARNGVGCLKKDQPACGPKTAA